MKYIIQMQDGSYYLKAPNPLSKGAMFTTSKLSEAYRFDTRFSALAVCGQSVQFANSKIVAFNPEVVGDGV